MRVRPSYKRGWATRGASVNPGLWRALGGVWAPFLGIQGGKLFDHSGFRQNATLNGGVSWALGPNGYELDYNGTTGYLSMPDSDKHSFGDAASDSPLTFFAHICMDDATRFFIVTKGQTGGSIEFDFATAGSDVLFARFMDLNTSNSIQAISDNAFTADEGNPISVATTYTGGGSETDIELYRNGKPISHTPVLTGSYTAMHNTGFSLNIGRRDSTTTPQYANGKIGVFAMWRRVLLSSELLLLHNFPHILFELAQRRHLVSTSGIVILRRRMQGY